MAAEPSAQMVGTLSLTVGDKRIAIDADRVTEVIRRPVISRVPNGPVSLVGICNLRGMPLPVVDMRCVLGLEAIPGFPGERVVVYRHSEAIGLLVGEVSSHRGGGTAEFLTDLDQRLSAIFRSSNAGSPKRSSSHVRIEEVSVAPQLLRSFLAFSVSGQTFGIALEVVEQVAIVPLTQARSTGGRASGMHLITFRDRTLPVVHLADIVGLPSGDIDVRDQKVVVINHNGGLIGLRVDAVDAILRLPVDAIDPVPPLLKASTGTAELESIGRYDSGRSLVAILSPRKLFARADFQEAASNEPGEPAMHDSTSTVAEAFERFLLFQLGEETYGIPLAAIDEVIRLPEMVTRVPNAPDFVLGITNFRGSALPLIDQRTRFGSSSGAARPRAIVMTVNELQAGFVVDAVSDVVSVSVSNLAKSPDFSSEATIVFDRVAHIEVDGRMILLIDPIQLLSGSERDLVSAVASSQEQARAS